VGRCVRLLRMRAGENHARPCDPQGKGGHDGAIEPCAGMCWLQRQQEPLRCMGLVSGATVSRCRQGGADQELAGCGSNLQIVVQPGLITSPSCRRPLLACPSSPSLASGPWQCPCLPCPLRPCLLCRCTRGTRSLPELSRKPGPDRAAPWPSLL